jgi:hypothetical protein
LADDRALRGGLLADGGLLAREGDALLLLFRWSGLGDLAFAALLFAGEFFDGDFSSENIAGELAGIAWDVGHGVSIEQ